MKRLIGLLLLEEALTSEQKKKKTWWTYIVTIYKGSNDLTQHYWNKVLRLV